MNMAHKWVVTVRVPPGYGEVITRIVSSHKINGNKRLTVASENDWHTYTDPWGVGQLSQTSGMDKIPTIVAINGVPWRDFPDTVRSWKTGLWVIILESCTLADFKLEII